MTERPHSPLASAIRAVARACLVAIAAGGSVVAPTALGAQEPPDRVLVRSHDEGPEGPLEVDRGAADVWHRLQKLRTTVSVLYTAGHPDDEEAGVLTLLSRGMGVRTALLTLNRGEGGANAIGPELFDALGLIRTEELRLSGRYYGLDDQYFTTAVDYGYSKTLDEAMRSWDREAVLADMVRIIRLNRPTVVISRWHGSERDGHGHHQASGVLTPEAVEAAADPTRFPGQITDEGLRPWRVRRLYRGRLLADEAHDAELDPFVTSPWLGRSYQELGTYGLSLQRSQTQGRMRSARGPGQPARYERLPAPGNDDARIAEGGTPLDALPDRMQDVGALVGEPLPAEARRLLARADEAVYRAIEDFDPGRPHAVIGLLSDALREVRQARGMLRRSGGGTPALDVDFVLRIKERQAADALIAAAGVEVRAVAVARGDGPDATMGPAVPGQAVDVHVSIAGPHLPHERLPDVRVVDAELRSRVGGGDRWGDGAPLREPVSLRLRLDVPDDAESTRSWFQRDDVRSNVYRVLDSAELHLGESRPRAEVRLTLSVDGTEVDRDAPVLRRESDAPYGTLLRPFEIAPAVAVAVTPALVLPRSSDGGWEASVSVTSNAPDALDAVARFDVPDGWRALPASAELAFGGPGEVRTVTFRVAPEAGASGGAGSPPTVGPRTARAVVTVNGREYRDGYRLIDHRDLQTQRRYEPAEVMLPDIDARVPDDVRVGYVMGVGDAVPEAIEQLSAAVTLLDADALEGGALAGFDAIVVGTRAYAVRPDLVAANGRLLDYARGGGHLVVLYQTPEYDPGTQAPFPASLPGNAEETSEEDAPITLLAPDHPLVTTPYAIRPEDFDGWIEQRGSKFFAEWAPEYTPLVETHDTGQAPQEGVWLTASVGEGRYTYVALALHRQLPYGVPGAYRILANLLVAER